MAGERKGKTYEALVKVALDQLKAKGVFSGDVFWNVKASGMTVTPDFTIGKDADSPNKVILITHSGSAKNSDMKAWRNLGELAECKLRLKSVPKVFSVGFDSIVKEKLKAVGAVSFDGQLIVGDRPYGQQLVKWIHKRHATLPADTDDKIDAFRDLLVKKHATFTPLFLAFLADLEALLLRTNPALDSLWAMERKRSIGKAPIARKTYVRRGLSKLLVFEDIDTALQLFRGKPLPATQIPNYAYDLDFAKKFTVGTKGIAKAGDDEILGAVKLLTDAQIKSIYASFDIRKIVAWLTMLRNAPHLRFMADYVQSEYTKLCHPPTLLTRLTALRRNPWAHVNKTTAPLNWPPADVWLFTFAIEILKAGSTSSNGFGYAQLAAEVSAKPGMPKGNHRVYTIVLSDWLLRRGREKMPRRFLAEVCKVIANHLGGIGAELKNVVSRAVKETIANVIETKLCCYRSFDPLESLISMNVPGFSSVIIRSCYAEVAGDSDKVGRMQVGCSQSTVINWQSATDDGKDHKVKELCGRAAALRYTWDAKAKTFVPRKGVKKLYLVIDGTWTQEDLDILARAGWDEIFYPDEMDKLAKAIV